MNIISLTNSFKQNLNTIHSLLENIEEAQIRWKQSPEKWNLLEIICHLLDEEKEDFRTRLKSVLENPENPFPPIDPPGWVISRNYGNQDFKKVLTEFIEERKKSVDWLKSLNNVNWDNTYLHPKIGPMSARYIITNWLAHDYLHIRQILKLKYDYLKEVSQQNLSYAGDW